MKKIDTRGLSCPQPVILVKNEIEKGNEDFEVLLDSEVSCENVQRLLRKHGLSVEMTLGQDHKVYHVRR